MNYEEILKTRLNKFEAVIKDDFIVIKNNFSNIDKQKERQLSGIVFDVETEDSTYIIWLLQMDGYTIRFILDKKYLDVPPLKGVYQFILMENKIIALPLSNVASYLNSMNNIITPHSDKPFTVIERPTD